MIHFVVSSIYSLLETWRQKYYKCNKCLIFGMAMSKSLNYFKSLTSITCWWILKCNSKRYLQIIFQGKTYERTILTCVSANTLLRSIKNSVKLLQYRWNIDANTNEIYLYLSITFFIALKRIAIQLTMNKTDVLYVYTYRM